jgi:hypothetical protein
MKIRFWFICSLLIGMMVVVNGLVSDTNIVLNDHHRIYDATSAYMHPDASIHLVPAPSAAGDIFSPRCTIMRESFSQRVMDINIRSPV